LWSLESSGYPYLNIRFVNNRSKAHWGDFGIIKGTINSLLEILNYEKDFDYILLLSGQDYPIKPIKSLMKYLNDNNGKQFVEFLPLKEKNGMYKWHVLKITILCILKINIYGFH
jgi:hypothetical protein